MSGDVIHNLRHSSDENGDILFYISKSDDNNRVKDSRSLAPFWGETEEVDEPIFWNLFSIHPFYSLFWGG